MPHTHTVSNTRLALLVAAILALLFLAFWLAAPSAKATHNPFPTTTDFVCEMGGEWSNRYFNVKTAVYMGNHDWALSYADHGRSTTYVQRPGEDCRTETYTDTHGAR